MSQSSPFFSICVPTRNRSETLYHCLKTLLHQDFESYEVILSDNCDSAESEKTIKITREFACSKIKYFKPDTILSMADNYEFALSKAKGEFILCIGDDDGIIIDSLQYLYNFIKKYDAKVVKSPIAWYYWLHSIDFPDSLMVLPFVRPVTIVDSKSILEKVASFEMGYFNLPMLYYSFVAKEIIDDVIAEQGSFFQNTASIDMYSGFVVAYKTQQFHIADKPFVIAGLSNKSNGASTGNNLANTVSKEFFKQHNLVEVYKKFQVPLLPQYDLSTFVLLEIKKFVYNYNIPSDKLKINARKVILNFLATHPVVDNADTLKFADYFKAYPVYQDDIEFIEKKFLGKQLYFPFLGNSDVQLIPGGEVIDPNLFDSKNVYDAAVIFKKLVDNRESLEPLYISIKQQPQHQPVLARRAFNRIKRAISVLLGN